MEPRDTAKDRDMSQATIPAHDDMAIAGQTMPPAIGLFEMVLEVADLAASERFYHDVIGLPIVERWTDDRRAVWLGLGREGFLGLWPPETGGAVAIHGGRGGRHVQSRFACRWARWTRSGHDSSHSATRLNSGTSAAATEPSTSTIPMGTSLSSRSEPRSGTARRQQRVLDDG
jgi:hypothetical protein